MTRRSPRWTRRRFLKTSAGAAATVAISGSLLAQGKSPAETLRVANVGVGGMGRGDLGQVSSDPKVQVIALCDVDSKTLVEASLKCPTGKPYTDWRVMLDKEGKNIDAVVVSTPDHMHGPIALAAMDLGKHVYCQKPIAHNLRECRAMAELAKANHLVTQMGTQIHAHAAYRTAVATLQSGVIGKVKEAHLWVSKSWAGPKEGRPDRVDPVPDNLNWDMWLGVAPERPFVRGVYHPARWRGWQDFGSGTLGDMGCHIFDPVFSALKLGTPHSVISRGPAHYAETFAPDGDVTYEFAGTEYTTDTLTMRWTDGRTSSRPAAEKAQLPQGVELPGAGSFLVGEKGVMVIPHWAMPTIYANGEKLEVELVKKDNQNHYHEWTAACRGEGKTSTPFSYSGPLTEAVLMGVVAGSFKDQQLAFNPETLTFDDEAANQKVGRTYRKGWEVQALLPG